MFVRYCPLAYSSAFFVAPPRFSANKPVSEQPIRCVCKEFARKLFLFVWWFIWWFVWMMLNKWYSRRSFAYTTRGIRIYAVWRRSFSFAFDQCGSLLLTSDIDSLGTANTPCCQAVRVCSTILGQFLIDVCRARFEFPFARARTLAELAD